MRQLRLSATLHTAARTTGNQARRIKRAACALLLTTLLAPIAAPAQFSDIFASLPGVCNGAAIWGNYDGDSDLDVLLTGRVTNGLYISKIFRQDPGWAFTDISAGFLPQAHDQNSRSAWGDYDNDGDLDLVITGYSYDINNLATRLYRNDSGTFVEVLPRPFMDVRTGTVCWGDYDNDGDLDLFLAGSRAHLGNVATVYRNNGAAGGWTFTDMAPPALIGADCSEAAWGDYDKDGDLDLAVMGYSNTYLDAKTRIYRNDGGGQLVNSGIPLMDLANGSLAWGDYNNDGYLDLALSGRTVYYEPNATRHFQLYRNNQNGTFTAVPTSIPNVSDGSVAWGDCNNDGKLDLLVTGKINTLGTRHVQVYTGNGTGGFTSIGGTFTGVYDSQGSWGDFDSDGRLDVLAAGRIAPDTTYSKIYRNTILGSIPNNAPSAPTGLTALAAAWNSIKLSWNPGTDIETPQVALTYNLHIIDHTTGETIMPGMSNFSTGDRHIPAMGNTNHTRTWTIGGLTPGHTYKAYVQTVDHELKASNFTLPVTVTLPLERPDVMIGDCTGDAGAEPNPACGGIITGTYWNSPNIWVRRLPDGNLPGNDVNQRPVVGATNYFYVRLTNIGTAALPEGRVYGYFSKASTGLAWPIHWNSFIDGGLLKGDVIGSVLVTNMLPGETRIVSIPWTNVPPHINSPSDHHFCLIARLVAASDPMTVPEGANLRDNTVNNNNIAWRNVSSLFEFAHQADINVRNVAAVATMTDLGFGLAETGDLGTVLAHCDLHFKLPNHIMQRWIQGGQQGEGIEVIEAPDGSGPMIRIQTPQAFIRGILLDPEESFMATVEVAYPQEWPDWLNNQRFLFDLVQFAAGSPDPVGGETYEVWMAHNASDALLKTPLPGAADLGSTLQVVAHPNPTSAGSTISYTLLADSRVSLWLYDAAGRRVGTLLNDVQQKAGRHSTEWSGTGADGTMLPSGVYFYRVETAEGSAQGQISVTR